MIGDFFELCERLTKLEQAVRDLIVHTKATERPAKCKLAHVQPARERLLEALPDGSPGISAREAALAIGCNKQYAHQRLMELVEDGLAKRGETDAAYNGTQLYWRVVTPSSGGEPTECPAQAPARSTEPRTYRGRGGGGRGERW